MNRLGALFKDDYNFEALTVVALAMIMPMGISAVLLGLNITKLVGLTVLGVEAVMFPLWLMTNSIREAGRTLEKRMFAGWLPTVQCLRLRDHSGYEVNARRDKLQQLSGVTLLNKRQEQARPNEADERIRHAVDIVKEKMRDPERFMLLRRELKAYGFWRNSLAVRRWALLIALSGAVVSVVFLIASSSPALPLMALVVNLLACVYWQFIVREQCVIEAAERYKDQFFKSLMTL